MAKVIQWVRGGVFVVNTDCGHWLEAENLDLDLDDEVHCQVCAEVTAARVEALKEMRQELCHVTALELSEDWRTIQNTFDGIFDKLIKATK